MGYFVVLLKDMVEFPKVDRGITSTPPEIEGNPLLCQDLGNSGMDSQLPIQLCHHRVIHAKTGCRFLYSAARLIRKCQT